MSPAYCAAPMESRNATPKDYYAVLGVAPDATSSEIKKAYRALAHRFHPDRMSKDDDTAAAMNRMVEINEAFAIVSDEKKRAEYDQLRNGPPKAAESEKPGSSDWEMPEEPAPTPAATPVHSAVSDSVNEDFLQKLKTIVAQSGGAGNLKEEPARPWLWSFLGKTWGGSYSVSLRLCPTMNPNVARENLSQIQAMLKQRRSSWKNNVFLFILGFHTLSEGETVLKLLRAFCNQDSNCTKRNLVNIVVMDMSSRRSVLCGKRVHDTSIEPVFSALSIQ